MKEFSAQEARYGCPTPVPQSLAVGSRSRDISLAVFLPDSDAESDDEPLISRRPGLRRSQERRAKG